MEETNLSERILQLEKAQVETGTYVKTIQQDIADIKIGIRELSERIARERSEVQSQYQSAWQNVAAELIKLASLSVVILGAIVGAVKLMGH